MSRFATGLCQRSSAGRRRPFVLSLCIALVLGANRSAWADLSPPAGEAVTGGLLAGAVLHQGAGSSAFVDAELAWTHYPSEFANGFLTPGVVLDAGYEHDPARARVTLAGKLGIFYILSVEAGIALRADSEDTLIGASGRVRVNLPIGELVYLSPYARRSMFSGGARDTELGVGLKVMLWGDSSKLEGVLNR